jgi:hypothetical protein
MGKVLEGVKTYKRRGKASLFNYDLIDLLHGALGAIVLLGFTKTIPLSVLFSWCNIHPG